MILSYDTAIGLILCILLVHFIADFIVQTDWQAQNKSKSNNALLRHILTYSACMCIFGPLFAVINGVLHFFTDFATSRIGSKLWKDGNRRGFFICVGADQLFHNICLIGTIGFSWWVR